MFFDSNHYLNKSMLENDNYYKQYMETISCLRECMTEGNYNDLINNKLQISHKFEENQYLQFAVETTVNSYFARRFKDSFLYEVKSLTTKENVDCQIEYKGYKYNIEIKCPNITKREEGMLYTGIGTRVQDFEMIKDHLKHVGEIVEEKVKVKYPWEPGGNASKDNTLATYLVQTQSKVGIKHNPKVINVLVVSLYSSYAFSDWITYLCMNEGLFRENSYKEVCLYNEVDFVIFTNIVNSHKNWNQTKINAWKFEEHYNLIFANPYSKTMKRSGMDCFYKEVMCDNYQYDYDKLWEEKENKFRHQREKKITNFITNLLTEVYKLPKLMSEEFIINRHRDFYVFMRDDIKNRNNESRICFELDVIFLIENLSLATELYVSLNKELFVDEESYIYAKGK